MPMLMCWTASGGTSPALAAQRAKPVLGHQAQPQQPLGEGIILLCSALYGISWSPRGSSGPLAIGHQLAKIPMKPLAPFLSMAERRREMGKSGKTPGLG